MSLLSDVPTRAGGADVEVRNLSVEVDRYGSWVSVVDDVSLSIRRGDTLGLVGESGSGKSLTATAIMGLLPPSVRMSSGSVELDGLDIASLPSRQRKAIRGPKLGMVFQDPQNSLNPAYTIGNQLVETIRAHRPLSRRAAADVAASLLDRVGITHARERLSDYPHQFSGGMAQRVMIALAIASKPKVLIADEPTTALDVTVQVQILRLLQQLCDEDGMSLLLISHDLSVIAEMADRVAVMYAGQIVETGPVNDVFLAPAHPYTEALLGAQPGHGTKDEALVAIPGTVPDPSDMPAGCRFHTRCAYAVQACVENAPELLPHGVGATSARCVRMHELSLDGVGRWTSAVDTDIAPTVLRPTEVLLDVRELTKEYPVGAGVFGRSKRTIRAVDDVTLDVRRGESVGLVGESGAGKSTVGRLLLGLTPPTHGTVGFEGRDISKLKGAKRRAQRRDIQVVFQNPYASLDPLMTVEDIVAEPIDIHESLSKDARRGRALALLERVGLDATYLFRYPHQLSGGQRQRIAIARALAPNPKLIVCDEPVSSLDVSTQAQVINLLKDLQRDVEVAYLFVGHDLEVVRHVCDRVAVMYLGRVVELGPSEEIYRNPRHPYTKMLLDSVLSIDPRNRRLRRGRVVDADEDDGATPAVGAAAPTVGCPFADRCPSAFARCEEVDPANIPIGDITVRCHLYEAGDPDGEPGEG